MAPSNVAFTIMGWQFYWYGIVIALGALLGILVAMKGSPKYGVSPDDIIDTALIAIPLAIVGGRLYYVAFSLSEYLGDWRRIFAFREGGMAIYGSIIGGALGVLISSKWKKINFIKLLDILAPALVLGQCIGRWGNFFNQEAYGIAITNPAFQWFPIAVYIENMVGSADGPFHMATFFYESAACLAIFIYLMQYRCKERQTGNVFLWYMVLYGAERAIVEQFRTDSLWLGPVRISQIVSLVTFAAGVAMLVIRANQQRKLQPVDGSLDPRLRILKEHEERKGQAEELLTGLAQDDLVVEEIVIEDDEILDDPDSQDNETEEAEEPK